MPRMARAVAVGFTHHVIQRGNNRERVFLTKKDREKYLSLLKKYSNKRSSLILAYRLMSNHVHSCEAERRGVFIQDKAVHHSLLYAVYKQDV